MTGNFTLEELNRAYQDFSEKLFNEIKNLKQEREELQVKTSTNNTNIRTLSGDRRDLFFVVDNEEYFRSVDNSQEMSDSLKALKLFKDRGYTENTLIPKIINDVFSSPLFSEEMTKLQEEISSNEIKSASLKNLIDELEEVRSGKELSIRVVSEYAKKFGYDTITYRKIMLSYLRRGSKKNNNKREERIELSIKEPVMYGEQLSFDLPSYTAPVEDKPTTFIPSEYKETKEEIKEETTNEEEFIKPFSTDLNFAPELSEEEIAFNLEAEREIEELKSRYYEISDVYNSTIGDYNELLSNYYLVVDRLTPLQKYNYQMLEDIGQTKEQLGDYTEEYAQSIALKIFEIKEKIEKKLAAIKENEFKSPRDIEELDSLVKSFNTECTKLQLVNEKLKVENGPELPENPLVYFLTDTSGNLVIDTSDKNLMDSFEKLARYDKPDSFMKRASIKNKNDNLGTTVYSSRTDNSIINYIRVETNGGMGMMILNGSPLSNGYKDSYRSAEALINQKSLLIKAQLSLIKSQDPEYLSIQDNVRKQLSGQTLVVRGE